jgi:hypothetical protein
MFLKYLAKMDLILILSKFSGQIGPKPKRFVFHSTIWLLCPSECKVPLYKMWNILNAKTKTYTKAVDAPKRP